jgi:hypothetical protein
LTDEGQCSGYEGESYNPEGLKAARDEGYIVPKITGFTTGAFTEPNTTQTAYLIMVGECGAPHAVNWGTKRLAIFSGDKLVVNVDVQDHTTILNTYDLNGDGINELLITGGYMQSGYVSQWGALISFKDGRLRFDKKFESLWSSNCSSMEPKAGVSAAVIYYTGGSRDAGPEFRVDNYQAKCTEDSEDPKPSSFRYVSSGKPSKS